MSFVVEKDNGLIPQILSSILDECVNGVTLSDPDMEGAPIVYANKAFERLTGYTSEDIVGRNCRFLQGVDREQPERYEIAEALKKEEGIERFELKHFRKNNLGNIFERRLIQGQI